LIGKMISLNGRSYAVIGIMAPGVESDPPATFESVNAQPIDVWMPFQIDPGNNDQSGFFNVAARLKRGISLDAAVVQMRLATEEFRRQFPLAEGLSTRAVFTVIPIRDAILRGEGSPLSIFFCAVIFVLLIACANVANLLLARGTGRRREIAIRAALGAGRGRIIRELLAESVVLSLAGGALGIALGMVGIRALLALNTVNMPRIGLEGVAVTADLRVLGFTVLVSLTTGILFGILPALQGSRADLVEDLKEGGGRCGTGVRQSKTRSLLVISEVTLAFVLLVGAGLLVRTFFALRSVKPGLDAHNVLTVQISLTDHRFQKTAGVVELVKDSIQHISALPGVTSVASTCCLPIENRTAGDVIIAGRPVTGRSHGVVDVTTISPRYFDVFKIPVLRGRAFTERDGIGASLVVIISEAMARRYWPNNGALGDPLSASLIFPDLPDRTWQVVGIAGDVHADGLRRSAPAIVYFSVAQVPDVLNGYLVRNPLAWIVRTREQPQSLIAAIQNEFRKVDAGLPVPNIRSMDEVLSRSTGGLQFNTLLLAVFGGSALLLAAIGIYGFIAHSVQQRTQEIGIRLALGAQPNEVRNMIVFQGTRLTLIGICIGIISAFGLARIIAGFLFGVQVHDWVVFVTVPAFLSAVAAAAVWFPARRACRINPIEALRHE
jgi:putative ABC transport system permease protein